MLNKVLKNGKIIFTIAALSLVVFMVGGIIVIKGTIYFKEIYIKKNLTYLSYKVELFHKEAIASDSNNVELNLITNDNNKSIPVLLYHGIVDEPDGYNVLVEDFKDQMFYLKENEYQTITLQDFYDFMYEGKELPPKSFLLTFDDGRKDSYYPVDPVLKILDYNAVIFVITENLYVPDDTYYLTRMELKAMKKSGRWEIQSHTRNGHQNVIIDADNSVAHFLSNKIFLSSEQRIETDEEYRDRLAGDLYEAKLNIKEKLGHEAYAFAYPFSDYGAEGINYPEAKNVILDIVDDNYKLAFYQPTAERNFISNNVNQNPYLIKRINVYPDWTKEYLLNILSDSQEKDYVLTDDFDSNQGWKNIFGDTIIENGKLKLKANDSNKEAATFLDGTNTWQDYAFTAKVNWIKGDNLYLLARYKDESNYVSCNFSNSYVRVENNINGEKTILKETKRYFDGDKKDFKIGIKVEGNKVECLLNNKIVAKYDGLEEVKQGGISIKAWSNIENKSEIEVDKIEVNTDWTDENLITINHDATKILPYNPKNIYQDQGWENVWGKKSFYYGTMILSASPSGDGGLTYLKGAKSWNNYLINSTIDWTKGDSITTIIRYVDDKNYLAFTISDDYFRLEEYKNGIKTILSEQENNLTFSKDNLNIGVWVYNNTLGGIINGQNVIYYDKLNNNNKGGIAYKIWDEEKGQAEIVIKKIDTKIIDKAISNNLNGK